MFFNNSATLALEPCRGSPSLIAHSDEAPNGQTSLLLTETGHMRGGGYKTSMACPEFEPGPNCAGVRERNHHTIWGVLLIYLLVPCTPRLTWRSALKTENNNRQMSMQPLNATMLLQVFSQEFLVSSYKNALDKKL